MANRLALSAFTNRGPLFFLAHVADGRETSQHQSDEHCRPRRALQPRAWVDPRDGDRRALRRVAQHGRVPDRLPRAQHVARSFCRGRALDRVRHDILAAHRNRRGPIGLGTGEQGRDPDPCFHERDNAPRDSFCAVRHRNSRARLPRGKSRPNDPADADHVSVHPPRFARRARHGNAERETRLWNSGDGFELLQYRLDRRRRGVVLLARSAGGLAASAFRRTRTGRARAWDSARRSPAVACPGSLRLAHRFSFPVRLRLARSRRAHDPGA